MPAFLEVNIVELRQRDVRVRSRHLPDLHLACAADRTSVLRDDLYRKVRQSAHLARVRRNLEHDTHLAPLARCQNLLSDEIDEPVVVLRLVGDDGKVGRHAHERDSFRRNLGPELPLVERQIPVLAVEDDVASPGDRILNAGGAEVLGQPSLQATAGEVQIQYATDHPRSRRLSTA